MFPLESPFPFFILHVHLCYELNDFLFCFSLVVFDGLIITSLRVFVNTFLCFYAIIFIYLFYYEELSVAMIADILQRKEATILTWLHRARKQLKNRLEEGDKQ